MKVKIWDHVISEDQIQSSMISELSGLEEGLVAYWNFNEGNGPTLNDLSGDNNGTINGAIWSGTLLQCSHQFKDVRIA